MSADSGRYMFRVLLKNQRQGLPKANYGDARMRGLTLTRKEGEHVVLTVQRGDEVVVLAVVTLARLDSSSARLRIMASPEIGIRRYQGPLTDEVAPS
jgi:hypothetical protein